MKKRLAVLVCALALGGCRGMPVRAFGIDLNKPTRADELSTDEKVGVVVVLGVAVAIAVGVGAASN